jgi:hypothetical protein
VDSRALGSLRLVQGRLGHSAAWAKREIRLSGRVQDASERMRVPHQLQRERARRVPDLPTLARLARGHGQSVQWKRLYRPLELRSEDEVLVFLVAHEAFHYLRKTRQVEGRHGEIEADAFALMMLEHYRDGSDPDETQIPGRW